MKKKFRNITVNGIEYAWNVKAEYDDWPFQPLMIWLKSYKSTPICRVKSFHNLAIKPKYVGNIIENITQDNSILTQFMDTKRPLSCYLVEVCSNLNEQDKTAALNFHDARGHRLNYYYSS